MQPATPVAAVMLLFLGTSSCCSSSRHQACVAPVQPRMVSVAIVSGMDKLTLFHVTNALRAEGIDARAGGSISYGVEVPADVERRARQILRRDGEAKGYSLRGRVAISVDDMHWRSVDLGASPQTLPMLAEQYPDESIVGAVVSSDDFKEYVDREVPVRLAALQQSPRDFMGFDGQWTTAYLVRVHLLVAEAAAQADFQLVPMGDGHFSVWRQPE